jgi:DNA polymerase-4
VAGRFTVYRTVSAIVMTQLRTVSPLIEPLSLDEAFVDLTQAADRDLSPAAIRTLAEDVRMSIQSRTGVTASIGVASSKLMAKIASEQAKPNGVVIVEPGTELGMLHPLPIRLTRVGVRTIGDLASMTEADLVDLIGEAHGRTLHLLSHARDNRKVIPERESKSISVEDTFDRDLTEPALLSALTIQLADKVARRLVDSGVSGRTITLKVRRYDFTTVSRSTTLPAPTDSPHIIGRVATRMLDEIDMSGGVRLLGVGLSGLSEWVQDDLFSNASLSTESGTVNLGTGSPIDSPAEPGIDKVAGTDRRWNSGNHHPSSGDDAHATMSNGPRWVAGMDVVHTRHGAGWVWGSGRGRVTVRFETATTPPGPVRTFADDDPNLRPAPLDPAAEVDPLPLPENDHVK